MTKFPTPEELSKKTSLPVEDCAFIIKEEMLNQISIYTHKFVGHIHKKLRDISLEELEEVFYFVKFGLRPIENLFKKEGNLSEREREMRAQMVFRHGLESIAGDLDKLNQGLEKIKKQTDKKEE